MNVSLQLTIGMGAAHRNQYLFSDHYLNNLLPDDARWSAALPEAEAFLAWLQDLYAREKDQLPEYNEDQLEEHWFKPIFTQLGHTFEGQASVPGLEAGVNRPDYVFFPDEATRQAAVSAQRTEDYTAEALAVGEVKRWDTALSKKQRGGGASFEAQNPSWQIDYYVRATGLDWGILSNGRLWRLVHEDSSQRLSIYYEVDLVDLLSRGDDRAHSQAGAMRYFTLFFRQAAFRPDAQGRIFLDDALAASNAYAVALEEDLEQNVYQALEHLMQGFLDLSTNHLGPDDLRAIYDNSLYLLYRLLFILYGESRGLLPLQNDQYRTNYSLTRLKEKIVELELLPVPMSTAYWGWLKNLFRIINGDHAELNRCLGMPRYNGRLFDPQQHPFLEEKIVGDRALIQAIDLLSRRVTEAGREFADYRTLGVRHLGSIYEGLLEYQPRYASEPMVAIRDGKGERWVKAEDTPHDAHVIERRDEGQVYLETDRGERKATGSYYTPQYIVEYIVENTVGPLVDEATERVSERRPSVGANQRGDGLVDEILNLKVLDPAMGSGHFLVEATEFLARALATNPYVEAEAPEEEDLTYWKRRVVERCIHGVDKNPLAVELAKLSLWLATVAAERPLSFLDHHLKCGDSLIGARVEDLGEVPPVMLNKKALKERQARYEARVRQANLFETRLVEKLPVVMGRILEITEVESKDYDTVRAKEATDQAVRKLKEPFVAVADLWVSAYFGNEFINGEYDEALMKIGQPEELMKLPAVQRAKEMADQRHFFHWELAFPEVFYDQHGKRLGEQAGFDAVVGNPPYVRVQRIGHEYSDYLFTHYETCSRKIDLSLAFLERSLQLSSREGLAGFISSSQWLSTDYGEAARRYMGDGKVVRIADFGSLPVFDDVSTYPAIFILSKARRDVLLYAKVQEQAALGFDTLKNLDFREREYRWLDDRSWILEREDLRVLLARNTQIDPLSEWGHFFIGALTGCDEVFVVSEQAIQDFDLEADLLIPYAYRGEEIERYGMVIPLARIIYPYKQGNQGEAMLIPEVELKAKYPNIYGYLSSSKQILTQRRDSRRYYAQGSNWYRFLRPGRFDYITPEKLLIRGIATESCVGVLDQNTAFNGANCPGFISSTAENSPMYLLALLNSHLISEYLTQVCPAKLQGYTRFNANNLNEIPIRRIEFTTPADERTQLVEEAKDRAEEAVGALASSGVLGSDTPMDQAMLSQAASPALGFVEERLAAEPEQADVVHDLLAHLAEQMIAMHKEKQSQVEAFWLDLEGITDAETFETLRHKGKWERTLWQRSKACRPFVDEESRSTRRLDESLGWNEDAFKVFVKALVSRVQRLSDLVGVYRAHSSAYRELIARIEATDWLIDQIVYRLYGLTEEEIAIVKGA